MDTGEAFSGLVAFLEGGDDGSGILGETGNAGPLFWCQVGKVVVSIGFATMVGCGNYNCSDKSEDCNKKRCVHFEGLK